MQWIYLDGFTRKGLLDLISFDEVILGYSGEYDNFYNTVYLHQIDEITTSEGYEVSFYFRSVETDAEVDITHIAKFKKLDE